MLPAAQLWKTQTVHVFMTLCFSLTSIVCKPSRKFYLGFLGILKLYPHLELVHFIIIINFLSLISTKLIFFQDSTLKIATVVIPVHERAVRNCPWVSLLWQNYIRALVTMIIHVRGGWQRPLILPLFGFPWSPQLRNLSIIRELGSRPRCQPPLIHVMLSIHLSIEFYMFL